MEQLYENIEALDIRLTPEHIKSLESVLPFDVGFPHWFIVSFSSRFTRAISDNV